MTVKYGTLFSFFVFFLFSCSNQDQFPTIQFEKVESHNVVLNQPLTHTKNEFNDSVTSLDYKKELDDLQLYKKYYEERNAGFSLSDMEMLWNNLKNKRNAFNFDGVNQWIEVTGFLLEITGNGSYAAELEKTVYESSSLFPGSDFKEIEKKVIPWIYTKNVDHIKINMFANATLKYEHTLKGAVEITQETSYPDLGKVQIKFKMENKRYIEVFIYIPEWAENVTVVEKGVKYVATPGAYSQIVRKWSDGDFIEITFTTEKKPHWLQPVI